MGTRKIVCILNGSANSSKAEASCEQVADYFKAKGVDATIHVAKDGGAISSLVREAIAQGATIVAAGGGDGTISAVASELVHTNVALGVIPMGTLNHFAKDLGIPLEIPGAVDSIIAGKTVGIDIGAVNGHSFINNASVGLYPKLVAHREDLQAGGLSKWLAFVSAVYRALRDYAPHHVTITSEDHGKTVEKVPFVFIGNNEYEASGSQIGKRDRLDAGRLWVYRGHAATRLEIALLAAKTLGGTASARELKIFATEKFSLHTKRLRTKVALDGEVLDLASPLEFSIHKAGLTVIVPQPGGIGELAMRTIAHISDLHFGRIEPATLPALADALHAVRPDVLAVSGDLTQRARKTEFIQARDFLKTLPGVPIIVPGNHDVPLFNVLARWLSPLGNYRRYISDDLAPYHGDPEIAVLGVNTARSLTWKDGRVNRQQVEAICAKLDAAAPDALRVLVAHHPFDTDDARARDIVGRADMAMARFAACKVDVILTGHLHAGRTSASGLRYKGLGHSTLFVQAGTATSRRLRGAPNMWNLVRIDGREVTVESWVWLAAEKRFTVSGADIFQRAADGWAKCPPLQNA